MIDKCWNLKSETENIYRFVSGMMYEYLAAKSSFFKSNDMRTRRKRNFVSDNNSLWPRGVVPYQLDGNMCRFDLELKYFKKTGRSTNYLINLFLNCQKWVLKLLSKKKLQVYVNLKIWIFPYLLGFVTVA